jgi:hypothetical protein
VGIPKAILRTDERPTFTVRYVMREGVMCLEDAGFIVIEVVASAAKSSAEWPLLLSRVMVVRLDP